MGPRARAIDAPAVGPPVSIGGFGETLPNDNAHVALDPEKRDRFGMPLVRLTPHLEPADIARLRFMASKARKILVTSGAEDVFETYSSWSEFSPSYLRHLPHGFRSGHICCPRRSSELSLAQPLDHRCQRLSLIGRRRSTDADDFRPSPCALPST